MCEVCERARGRCATSAKVNGFSFANSTQEFVVFINMNPYITSFLSTGMAADAISERGMLEGVVEVVGQATVLLVRDEANADAVGWNALGPAISWDTPERLDPGKLHDM